MARMLVCVCVCVNERMRVSVHTRVSVQAGNTYSHLEDHRRPDKTFTLPLMVDGAWDVM